MNPKTCNIICIILAILIVALLVRAATNKGKIWGSEEKYINFSMPGNITIDDNFQGFKNPFLN
jgi:hypothetical protein